MISGSDSRVGLACAGGVVEGAIYEIGALRALEDAIEGLDFTRMGVYVGVSSGALITACLANGLSVKTLEQAVVEEKGADPELQFMPELLFVPALKEYARRLRMLPGSVLKNVTRYLRHPLDLSFFGILAGLGPLIPVGLFDNTPLRKYLERAFGQPGRTDDFRRLSSKLRIVAVELDTAGIVVFGRPGTDDVPISKAVQASTALPGLYCPVEIDGVHYIDGVARRTVHSSVALEEGCKLLFCINPIVPVDLNREAASGPKTDGLVEHGLSAVLSQTFRTLVYSRMQTGLRHYEHAFPGAELILIEPTFDDHSMFFSNIFSFSNRANVFRHAYNRTLAYLAEHEEELRRKLRPHGLRLRLEATVGLPEEGGPPPEKSSVAEAAERALTRLDALISRLDPEA